MPEELDVLKIVCQRLQQSKILYMITGSIASNFYTQPRMTRDIDIVIEIKSEDVELIYNAFQNDFYIDKQMVMDAIEEQSSFNIIHNEYIIKVDFIVRKNEEYRKVEFARRSKIRLGGTSLWITAAEDLILSKLFWAKVSESEIQLKDVKNLLESVKHLDMKYIKKWVNKLNLDKIYLKVKL